MVDTKIGLERVSLTEQHPARPVVNALTPEPGVSVTRMSSSSCDRSPLTQLPALSPIRPTWHTLTIYMKPSEVCFSSGEFGDLLKQPGRAREPGLLWACVLLSHCWCLVLQAPGHLWRQGGRSLVAWQGVAGRSVLVGSSGSPSSGRGECPPPVLGGLAESSQ